MIIQSSADFDLAFVLAGAVIIAFFAVVVRAAYMRFGNAKPSSLHSLTITAGFALVTYGAWLCRSPGYGIVVDILVYMLIAAVTLFTAASAQLTLKDFVHERDTREKLANSSTKRSGSTNLTPVHHH